MDTTHPTPSINTIPTSQLYGNYTIWNPVEETWSTPIPYTAAVEAYARDPELQASLILPDGTTTEPATMAEIIKRTHTSSTIPRDIETAAHIRQRNIRVQNQRTAAAKERQPTTTNTQPQTPATQVRHTSAPPIPSETIALLNHALRLFLCVTYGTFYLTAAGAIIGGLRSGENTLAISGFILGIITAAVHVTLSGNSK